MNTRKVAGGLTVLGFRENVDILLDEYFKNAESDYAEEIESKGIDPSTIDEGQWYAEVAKRAYQKPMSDIQVLLSKRPKLEWSAPKQDLVDGALFFYLGNQARLNVRACIREAQTRPEFTQYPALMQSLMTSASFIEKNSRNLIGVAKVTSIATYGSGIGFKGRNFAEIDSGNFHSFENPLSLDFLQTLPLVINGPTVYSLVGDKSTRIVSKLRKNNTLPTWLEKMTFGDTVFSHITAANWLTTLPTTSIVIDASVSSSPEQLLRFHYFNYLIKAIADTNSPILEESPHWQGTIRSGFSDYLFQVNNVWIPFEAKVNVNSEKDILGQIKKYTESDAFNMSIESSTRKIRQPMPQHRICLLGDQHGIYLTVNSEFVGCTATQPRWPRTQLSRAQLNDIRKELQKLLNQ
jgi:hypothetical protein